MKNVMLMSALSMAIVAGGAAESWAASDRGKGPRHSFEELDANSDGQLTRAEIDAHMAARFASADADGDGVLSKAELEARGGERAKKRVSKMMDRLDGNGDGAISLEEMQAGRGGKMFDRADADGDGAISKAEFEDVRAKHKGKKKSAD